MYSIERVLVWVVHVTDGSNPSRIDVLFRGAQRCVCDQGEYSGKKSRIGRNVKDKKSIAKGRHSPWILVPTDFATTMRKFISRNLPVTTICRREPKMFSRIAQSHGDSPPSFPYPEET